MGFHRDHVIPLTFTTLRGASEIQITLHFGEPIEVIITDLRKPIFSFYIYDLFFHLLYFKCWYLMAFLFASCSPIRRVSYKTSSKL